MEWLCAHCRAPLDGTRVVQVAGTVIHAQGCMDQALADNPGLSPQAAPDVSRETARPLATADLIKATRNGKLEALMDVQAELGNIKRALPQRIVQPATLLAEIQAKVDDLLDQVDAP